MIYLLYYYLLIAHASLPPPPCHFPPAGKARFEATQRRAQPHWRRAGKHAAEAKRDDPFRRSCREPGARIQCERQGAADTVAHTAADDATQRLRRIHLTHVDAERNVGTPARRHLIAAAQQQRGCTRRAQRGLAGSITDAVARIGGGGQLRTGGRARAN